MIGQGLGPGVSADLEDREARSYDFGRMTRRVPGAVATPGSPEEVSSIVRSCARDEIPLTIRGGGHSQGGQSLSDGGLVLDTMRLDRIRPPEGELVRAQGGAQWGKVLDALRGTRLLPLVMADIAEVTVGGTLSAGGLGTTSHRYGMQIVHVEQLEVVTGTGERVLCSRTRNADLFDAVRGGQGQFGIITEAWIRLRRAGERIRLYELRYRDFDQFSSDFRHVVDDDRFDHLRVQTRLHEQEIVLSAGVEYGEECDDREVLAGLGHDRFAIVIDTAEVGHAVMFPKWGFSRNNFHPWRDWFVPWEALPELLVQPWLDPRWVPRAPFNWTGFYPIRAGAVDAPLFMRPKGERMFSYSILSVLGDWIWANHLVGRLREITATLVGLGGKSYLSGGVGYGRREWEEHYGEKLELGRRWKNEFDPGHVFRGEGMPFGESPDGLGSGKRQPGP